MRGSLALLSSLLLLSQTELSALTATFPAEPPQKVSSEEENKQLIGNLNGIILINSAADLLSNIFKEINGVSVQNVDIPGDAEGLIENLNTRFSNKPLTQKDVRELERTIIMHYKKEFHPLVTVRTPQQEITQGVLKVIVQEAALQQVNSSGAQWFNNQMFADLTRLKEGEPINEQTLIEDLAWMNRNPFHKTVAIYDPGEKNDTTNVNLITSDRFPLRLYVGTDNTGLEPISRERVFAGFNWGNAFWADQQLNYQYTASYDFYKFQGHTLYYSAPLPWRHVFIVYGGYSTSHASMPTNFSNSGTNYQASGRYMIPILPGRKAIQEAYFGFDFKRTNNTVIFSEQPISGRLTNLTQFMGQYSLGYETANNKFSLATSLYFSPGEIVGDESQRDFQSLRPYAKTRYVYGRLEFTDTYRLKSGCSFATTVRGQLASCNLLPSEQFGIGGYNTVRGYEERAVNADDAFVFNQEFRLAPWRIFTKKSSNTQEGLQLLAFVDYGIGHNHTLTAGEKYSEWLLGIGPGIRYEFNPFISARFDFGFKFHDVPGDSRFGLAHFSFTAGY